MKFIILCIFLVVYFSETLCNQLTGKVLSVIDRTPVSGAFLRFSDHVKNTYDCSNAIFYDSATTNDSGMYVISWPSTSNPQNYSNYKDFQVIHPDYYCVCAGSDSCVPDQLYLVPNKDSVDVFFLGAVNTNYGTMVEGFTIKLMTLDSIVLDSSTSGKDGYFLLRYKPKGYKNLLIISNKQGYLSQCEMVPATCPSRVWTVLVMATPEPQPTTVIKNSATITGIIKDQISGDPVSGVKIRFMNGKMPGSEYFYDSTKITGSDGHFQFTRIAPMTEKAYGYVLRCEKDGYRIYTSKNLINCVPDEIKDTTFYIVKKYTIRVKAVSDIKIQEPINDAGVVFYSRTTHEPVYSQNTVQGVCDFYDPGIDTLDVSVFKYPYYPVVAIWQAQNRDTTELTAIFSSSSQEYKKRVMRINFSDTSQVAARMKSVIPFFITSYELKTLCMYGKYDNDSTYTLNTIPNSVSTGQLYLLGCQTSLLPVELSSDTSSIYWQCGLINSGLSFKNQPKSVKKKNNGVQSKITRYEIYDIAGRKHTEFSNEFTDKQATVVAKSGMWFLIGFDAYGKCIEKRKIINTNR